MNTDEALARLEALQQQLNAIEAQLEPPTSPADQAALDDEWLTLTKEMDALMELIWTDDTREGCEQCSGCMYCEASPGYDGADEI